MPILDSSGNIFRGNIYKMHIYRHKANGGDMTLPVTHLLKNATKFIYLDTSFFKVFFTIKELPYIAVLDSENHFYGILTHSTLLNMLSQSWSVEQRKLCTDNCFHRKARRFGCYCKNHFKTQQHCQLYYS